MILELKGYGVVLAGTVADGLRQLTHEVTHVVLDLMLPDGAGEAVLHQVEAKQLNVNVWVMTGVADTERLARLERLGTRRVLRKPINVNDLLQGLGDVQ